MDSYKEVWEHIVLLRTILNKRLSSRDSEWPLERECMHDELRVALGKLEYSSGLLQNLHRLQSEGESFCDVTIKVGDKVFLAHRNVLAAASPYFETMLTSAFKESHTREVELKDINVDIFEMLFNFIYSGEMDLSIDTAREAFHMAKYLQIRHTESIFKEFWIDGMDIARGIKLSAEEGLLVLEIAVEYDMTDLNEKCAIFLLRMFCRVMDMDDYEEKLHCNLMKKYMSMGLHGQYRPGEEKLLEKVIKWLKHDWDHRKEHAAESIQSFRLGIIPKDKVLELIDSQILEIPECKKILDDYLKEWEEFNNVTDASKLPWSFLTRNTCKRLVALQGKRDQDSWFAYEYDAKHEKKWVPLALFPKLPRVNRRRLKASSTVVVDGDIYLAGGKIGVEKSSCFFRYDAHNFTWTELPAMDTARTDFGLVHHEGFIYAIGGRNEKDRYYFLHSAERFNLASQTWDRLYTIPESMIYVSTAVLNGKMLVFGMTSYDEDIDDYALYELIVFDPVKNTWTLLLEESKECNDCKKISHDSVIVVQDGKCYRIWHEAINPLWCRWFYKPHVNPINIVEEEDGSIAASLGDEIPSNGQFYQPDTTKAFCIEDQVYVNVSGYVHKIGAVKDESDMDRWRECSEIEDTTVVEYTYDWEKLMNFAHGS